MTGAQERLRLSLAIRERAELSNDKYRAYQSYQSLKEITFFCNMTLTLTLLIVETNCKFAVRREELRIMLTRGIRIRTARENWIRFRPHKIHLFLNPFGHWRLLDQYFKVL